MYPAYIHTQTTARNIDHAAIKTYQIPSLILMEHAALKSAEIIEQITNTNQSIGSLTLTHGPNSQKSFRYGFFYVKFLFLNVVCVVFLWYN